ncbi:MAG: deoxyguanosinetriphosphate triphosphohydrolase [Dehalococcoidia bacterium]|jgi:dGTPase
MIEELNVRQLNEEREESLSPNAVKSRDSKGRAQREAPCPVRTAFQHDRDRIIHSKSFRRLKHKTQVFIAPLGDHYVTRLTHTLEVAQIARTIARALNLNEDLTEAIALGHDLGHTPFGHVGEDVLDELYPEGFSHNEQSLRVVDVLEKNGKGLNLTWEVRDGILNHSKDVKDTKAKSEEPGTFEGAVVKLSDMVAYINHDIDDAIRANMITERDLPVLSIAKLGNSHSKRINTMVCDIIENSWAIRDTESDNITVTMSPEIAEATDNMRAFLFERVYNIRSAQEESEKARETVRKLYQHFNDYPDRMPPEYTAYKGETERRVVDYIAGMTDLYAMRIADELAAFKGKAKPKPARKKPKTPKDKPPETQSPTLF